MWWPGTRGRRKRQLWSRLLLSYAPYFRKTNLPSASYLALSALLFLFRLGCHSYLSGSSLMTLPPSTASPFFRSRGKLADFLERKPSFEPIRRLSAGDKLRIEVARRSGEGVLLPKGVMSGEATELGDSGCKSSTDGTARIEGWGTWS